MKEKIIYSLIESFFKVFLLKANLAPWIGNG